MEQQGGRVRRLWSRRRYPRSRTIAPYHGRNAGRDRARASRAFLVHGFREFSRIQAGAQSRNGRNLDAGSAHCMGWSVEDCAGETEGIGDGLTATAILVAADGEADYTLAAVPAMGGT